MEEGIHTYQTPFQTFKEEKVNIDSKSISKTIASSKDSTKISNNFNNICDESTKDQTVQNQFIQDNKIDEITPNPLKNIEISNEKSLIFENKNCNKDYLELTPSVHEDYIKIIFRRPDELSNYKKVKIDNLNKFNQIILIFDFDSLSFDLRLSDVKGIIKNLYFAINNRQKTPLSIVIQNCLIKEFLNIYDEKNYVLSLKELIISDELYNISGNLFNLFEKVKTEKLVLKQFKINSKTQLEILYKFIISTDCKELELEDFFIELIIQKDENDKNFNLLDKYITFSEDSISLGNTLTEIKKLKLRDCPLFYLSEETFSGDEDFQIYNYYIDIDETSIINPTLITKFKIENGFFDICFDLDSYKCQNEEDIERIDYIDQLIMIFKIITGFRENDGDEGDIEPYNQGMFRKLKFKNFDTTKIEYVTGEQISFVKEEYWQLSNEEKEKKEKWENFEKNLKKYKKGKYPGLKILIFDNCTNNFIQNVMEFLCFKEENLINNKNKINNFEYNDLERLKFKKCGKENLNLKNILKLNIKSLILFDTPLIVDKYPQESQDKNKKTHLSYFNENNKMGKVENLTLCINGLGYYCKEFNLSIMKTYEIIIELLQNTAFNKKICFQMNALSYIFKYLAFKEYYNHKENYYNPSNNLEDNAIDNNSDNENVFIYNDDGNNYKETLKEPLFIPGHFFFDSLNKRNELINKTFKIVNINNKTEITLKNCSIKNEIEEFENHKYMLEKLEKKIDSYTKCRELEKIDYGYTLFNIDTDFREFFNINKIQNVNLENVSFSNYTHANHNFKNETILNLIGKTIIEGKNDSKIFYPNYIFDFKTIEGVFLKNYDFENIADLFKFIDKISDICEKSDEYKIVSIDPDKYKNIQKIEKYFDTVKKILEAIFSNKNDKKLKIKCKYKNEFKACFCLLNVFDLIYTETMKITLKLTFQSNEEKKMEIQDLKKLKNSDSIGNYFMREFCDEMGKDVYTELNYYYQSAQERNLLNNKQFKINSGNYIIEVTVDNYDIDDEDSDSK